MTIVFRLITLLFMALAAGCGGGSGGDFAVAVSIATAHMARAVAPSCGYDRVYVTVEKVLIFQSAAAADADSSAAEVILSPARRIDLVTLTNGVLEELGTAPLRGGPGSVSSRPWPASWCGLKTICAIRKAQFSKVLPYYGFDMSMVGGVHQLVGRAFRLGKPH